MSATIALWDPPTTATMRGVPLGRAVTSSLGFSTTSRSNLRMESPGTGIRRSVGEDPVQRIKMGEITCISSSESWLLIRTVHPDDCRNEL